MELSLEEYKRYGRQMILDGFGLPGQLKLKRARVAVIGAGGLGCPALQYLAGAGVGTIGIFDHDTVETSNLHRQVLHTTDRVGRFKAESAKEALHALNPLVSIEAYRSALLPTTAIDLLADFAPTAVLDCTDRAATRYMVSDACVKLGVPLISGAAIGLSGQWAVYGGHHHENREDEEAEKRSRPCYRCIWPKPLPSASPRDGAGTCEEEGVLGPTVGAVGVQMAAETIKVLIGMDDSAPRLNLMSLAPSATPFRSVRIRGPSPKCIACGPNAILPESDLTSMQYEVFCSGEKVEDERETQVDRVDVGQLACALSDEPETTILVDVRSATEYGICSLKDSINVPLETLLQSPQDTLSRLVEGRPTQPDVYFICRRGNDSLIAAAAAQQAMQESPARIGRIMNVAGGVRAWSRDVDPAFPIY